MALVANNGPTNKEVLYCYISPAEWPVAVVYVASAHAGRVQRGQEEECACLEG